MNNIPDSVLAAYKGAVPEALNAALIEVERDMFEMESNKQRCYKLQDGIRLLYDLSGGELAYINEENQIKHIEKWIKERKGLMPKKYEAIRDRLISEGVSPKDAKTRASKIFNADRKAGQRPVTGKHKKGGKKR